MLQSLPQKYYKNAITNLENVFLQNKSDDDIWAKFINDLVR
jgi:hypothetical protein